MSRPSSNVLRKATSVKLHYFAGRARAEKIRLAFAAGGIPYTEVTITDWPSGKAKTPYGSLPFLEVDGKLLGQSNAIFRFVAVESGLTGTDDWDDAILDAIVDAASDIETAGVPIFLEEGQKKEEATKKMFEVLLPDFLQRMEGFLQNTGSGWFSKKGGVTWADIMVFNVLDYVENISGKTNVSQSFPLLSKLRKNVSSSPGIKEYLEKRPEDAFVKK